MTDTGTRSRKAQAPIKAKIGLVEFQQRLHELLRERTVRASEQGVMAKAMTASGLYTLAQVSREVTITVNADSIRRRNPELSIDAATERAEKMQLAVQDICDRSAQGIKAAMQAGDAKLLPTPNQIDVLLRWLDLKLTDGQMDFIDRHSAWLKEAGIGQPRNFAAYARIYRVHSAKFGVGQNNTCEVCQVKFEATSEENAARVAEIDQASKAFDSTVELDF